MSSASNELVLEFKSAFKSLMRGAVVFILNCFISKKVIEKGNIRSKEFQRIHKSCIPHRRDAPKCTLVEMYPGFYTEPS